MFSYSGSLGGNTRGTARTIGKSVLTKVSERVDCHKNYINNASHSNQSMTSPRLLLLLLSTLSQVATFDYYDYEDPDPDEIPKPSITRIIDESLLNCTDQGEVVRWINEQVERNTNVARINQQLSLILQALNGKGNLCADENRNLAKLLEALNILLAGKEDPLQSSNNFGQDLINIFEKIKQIAAKELTSCCEHLNERVNQLEVDLTMQIKLKFENLKPNQMEIELRAKYTEMEMHIKEIIERLSKLEHQQNKVETELIKPDETCCQTAEHKIHELEKQWQESNKKIDNNILKLEGTIKIQLETIIKMNETKNSLKECLSNAKNISLIEEVVKELKIQIKILQDDAAKKCDNEEKLQIELKFKIEKVLGLCKKIEDCRKEIESNANNINANIELVTSKITEIEHQINILNKNGPNNDDDLKDLEKKLDEKLQELEKYILDRKKASAKFQMDIDLRIDKLQLQISTNNEEQISDIMQKLNRLEKRLDKLTKDKETSADLATQIEDLEDQLKQANKKLRDKNALIDDCTASCKNLDKLNDLIDKIEDFEKQLKGKITKGTTTTKSSKITRPTKKRDESAIGGIDFLEK